jgi:hypothetical protein
MKTIILSFITSVVAGCSLSAGIMSEPTNGIYVAIVERNFVHGPDPGTNEPFRCDNRLAWAVYCNTGSVHVRFPIDDAYGVRIRMFGPNGKEVKKTWLGRGVGAEWDKLHSYKDTRTQGLVAGGSFEENKGESSAGGNLPPPQKLFEMEQPGIYIMEIHIQLFQHATTRDTKAWSRNLLRFSPIRVKVEKPPAWTPER